MSRFRKTQIDSQACIFIQLLLAEIQTVDSNKLKQLETLRAPIQGHSPW